MTIFRVRLLNSAGYQHAIRDYGSELDALEAWERSSNPHPEQVFPNADKSRFRAAAKERKIARGGGR